MHVKIEKETNVFTSKYLRTAIPFL